ncbi:MULTISPECIES: hypothetical protein [unclassified Streptomyces]|uniref:hypothetical protein n=1 Tax=unclassified Streptomyces TaxID=2593676 RepID=UPI002ED68F32|nr:hypothetical protein OH827_00590 [Streptomyces sp. NBC_00891]WSY03606.1 hypothetical protein OG464_00590 [Streptomyces sp. NBC_00890]WSZ05233.1 hypothetical protein OG704_00590 [Streptomyces sp. NBC_00869]WSZ27272.1 hypothetical protein OG498_32975 [Streptomyces sp. NBC_00870]
MTSRSRISSLLGDHVIIIGVAVILFRKLLFEEARPAPGMYPRVPPPEGLLEREKEYLAWLDSYVAWLVRVARSHQRRFVVLTCASGLSALAISPAVAVRATIGIPAALGFISAACQFLLVLGQDQKLYLLLHEQSVKLQRSRRDLGFDTDSAQDSRTMRRRFTEFRQTVEKIKEDYGSQVFRIKGQEPPPPPQTATSG